ncbi:hypothetical protein [Micromonospora endophytica]|uniref:Uncharacterized protein n=1 Tax=Micromonospora endophytica TaxID=515350 RepID=A0A2W2BFM6_9ACTN|nr:hypothetical protein [Micromonospora endophytica]PZF84792.1 hypothetical protein C1I93_29125 [Micromonospora endophytica]RIW50898.1 hypothetical protein D3H59_01995 [Micromonospora endophytica]BCJ60581.1 hypothetical protein Jiend_40030 [Micromonospora endophytica]
MRQQEQQLNNDHPEAVRSASVPVPPADDHDVTETDAPTDRDRSATGTDRDRPWDRRPGDDDERPEFHEPAPVPTAFGATTVGSAVAASALASPRPEDERDARDEDTARPGDGAVDGEREGFRADPEAEFDRTGPLTSHDVDDTDAPAGDRRVPAAHHDTDDLDGDSATRDAGADERAEAAAAGGAGYGSATPTMVDPDTRTPGDGVSGAGVATPAGAATLFDESTAQGFRDRWRDVQLRFVDDPKAAAGEAQSLVDEAMQALSAALAEHKRKLGGWQEADSSDTEELRVAVREYRDFLDRVLGR